MSGINIPPRPNIQTTQSGSSFHTRALAVSAAHRFSTHGTPPSSLPSSLPRSTASGVTSGSASGYDIEAHPLSPSSSSSPLSPTSPRIVASTGTTAGKHHAHRRHHRRKSQAQANRWITTSAVGGGTGDEPGVDVKSKRDEEAYGHLKARTHVNVVDYSSNPDEDNTNVRVNFEGDRLKEWLDSEVGQRRQDEHGKPTGVRWIHIDGLNWEVVKTLTIHFGLHPLAVEDSLRAARSPRSKLDFYKSHLYLQLLIHHTHASDEESLSYTVDEMAHSRLHLGELFDGQSDVEADANERTKGIGIGQRIKRWIGGSSPPDTPKRILPEGVESVFEPTGPLGNRVGSVQSYEKQAHRLTVDELSAQYMVPIRRGILSIFMLRDGTLISMDAKPTREVLAPIYARLEDEQSLLRRSGDVSMLAEAILDTVADLSIEITQTFEAEILKVEASVLVDPQVEIVRHLHVLSSQLIRLRRSLTPLLHVCYIVRDQDIQRAAAASVVAPSSRDHQHGLIHAPPESNGLSQHQYLSAAPAPMTAMPSAPGTPKRMSPSDDNVSLRSFMMGGAPSHLGNPIQSQAAMANMAFFSPMTKVYIGDVIDHLEIVVGSMEQFVATCDHLTDYVFNVLSFQTNASMERLSIVTVVFLPLTFIASYFGMNFTSFGEIEGSVSYFWKVAIPCTTAFFVIFSFSYLKAFAATIGRKSMRWRRTREVELRASKGKGGKGTKGQ